MSLTLETSGVVAQVSRRFVIRGLVDHAGCDKNCSCGLIIIIIIIIVVASYKAHMSVTQ